MPRIAQGPRLKKRKQSGGKTIWYIINGDKRESTGFEVKDLAKAKEKLEQYKRALVIQPPSPDYYVQQALDLYRRDVAPGHTKPENTYQHLDRLLEFFKGRTCDSVTREVTNAYQNWRCHTGKAFLGEPPRTRRKVEPSTVRRELATLSAVLNHAYESRKIKHPIPITLPPKSAPRERWLTVSEATRLLLGSIGFILAPYSDIATRAKRWTIWRREKAVTSRHVARFILIGLRTGTRHDAINGLGWRPHPDGGHFDLERKLMFRASSGARQTTKRQPPAPIPDKLIRHLNRWKRQATSLYVVTAPGYEDSKLQRVTKAFGRAVERAGLGHDVHPHILRHTCVTWLMQAGRPVWEVAGFVGMSVQMVQDNYGHHAPDYLRDTANAR